MKYSAIIFSIFTFITICYSCNENAPSSAENTENKDNITANDSDETACSNDTETIMDPNGAKPMALMMRNMVKNAQQIREQVVKGENLDSLKYPFIRFYLVEPTDPNVLEPTFYENARLFQEAYADLFKHPKEQSKYYNVVIGKCINCHESYCSGPLKRIRKLLIPIK